MDKFAVSFKKCNAALHLGPLLHSNIMYNSAPDTFGINYANEGE
jgi:hypothetical protein